MERIYDMIEFRTCVQVDNLSCTKAFISAGEEFSYVDRSFRIQRGLRLPLLAMLFIGGPAAYTFVWDPGDAGIGLMTIFNLIALYPLASKALETLRGYEAKTGKQTEI